MKEEFIKYVSRNILRKKKQTFFTVLCVSVSSFVILTNIALNNGILFNLKNGINQAVSGQLTIYKTQDPRINILESSLKEQEPFHWDDKKTDTINKEISQAYINKRIRFGSLISYNDETSYVNIHAVENAHFERISSLLGIRDVPENGKNIIISESVAKDLHCEVGDTLLLVAENIYNYMSDEIAVVREIFEEKGLSVMLNYTAFMSYDFGADIVQLDEGECLELIVNSNDNTDFTEQEITQVGQMVSNEGENLHVAYWDKTVPLLFKIVNIWKGGKYMTQVMFLVFSLIILVNLISMIINSRRKEFGTLLAIGFSWKKITVLVCVEYLVITAFAVFAAFGLTMIITGFIPDKGIYIASKDLQSAMMTEYLLLLPYSKDFIYTLLLFCMTTLGAVLISLVRIKKLSPVILINNN